VISALSAAAPGLKQVVVGVPDGYEAATYDEQGHISFWKYTTAWQDVGKSTYPVVPGEPPETSLIGARLTGMSDATFIATGAFTGDGSGTALAYTNGSNGWGLLLPGSANTLVPTGTQVGSNGPSYIWYGMQFSGGELVASQENPFYDNAEGGVYALTISWKWTGSRFSDDHDDIFTAKAAAAPATPSSQLTSCPLPAGTLPADGTYQAYLTADSPGEFGGPSGPQGLVSDGQVHLILQRSATYSSASACLATVSPELPMTVQASTSSGAKVWVTAPAWFLGGPISTTIDPGEAYGTSPYYVPAALGITGIASNLGTPVFPPAAQESPATLTFGSVTIAGGKVSALAILPVP